MKPHQFDDRHRHGGAEVKGEGIEKQRLRTAVLRPISSDNSGDCQNQTTHQGDIDTIVGPSANLPMEIHEKTEKKIRHHQSADHMSSVGHATYPRFVKAPAYSPVSRNYSAPGQGLLNLERDPFKLNQNRPYSPDCHPGRSAAEIRGPDRRCRSRLRGRRWTPDQVRGDNLGGRGDEFGLGPTCDSV